MSVIGGDLEVLGVDTVANVGRFANLLNNNAPTSSKKCANFLKICSDLREKVDTSRVGEPAFLMIVMCGEFAYRRKDGVFVVPIGCLKD